MAADAVMEAWFFEMNMKVAGKRENRLWEEGHIMYPELMVVHDTVP